MRSSVLRCLMVERHTRANDCGCVETWDPVPGCVPGPQRWAYGLWLGCEEHARKHQEFLESMEVPPQDTP